MPLAQSNFASSNCVGLSGVYNGQGASELVFLGSSSANCFHLPFTNGGDLYVGFDTRIQPAVVRMFYTPPWLTASTSIVGFVQYSETKLQSTSIPPSVYSPEIAYRDEYLYDLFGQQNCLDVIPSYTIKQSTVYPFFKGDKNIPPYFAHNAILYDSSYTNFLPYPMPNGNLYQGNQVGTAGNTLCASLISPIGLGLDGPQKYELKQLVNACMSRKFYDYVKKSESGIGKLYNMTDIWQAGTLDPGYKAVWNTSFLTGMKTVLYSNYPDYEDREILQVEQVGMKPMAKGDRIYLLIKLSDPNDYNPYFCISIQQTDRGVCSVLMYEFDSHLLEDINNEVLEERSISFLEFAKSFYSQLHPDDRPSRIGVSDPYYTDDKITFRYKTYLVEYRTDKTQHILGGISWNVSKTLDAESLEFEPMQISSPPVIASNSSFEGIASALNSTYQSIINTGIGMDEEQPPSSVEQWFEPPPRLPNDMSVFGIKD